MNETQPLADITGTIVLAGAGKMGGAMLTGWLARGLDAKRVVRDRAAARRARSARSRQRAFASIHHRKKSAPPRHSWSR